MFNSQEKELFTTYYSKSTLATELLAIELLTPNDREFVRPGVVEICTVTGDRRVRCCVLTYKLLDTGRKAVRK